MLIDADAALDQVYFPESAVVSLSTVFADGTAVDMATIGREGCTGVQVVLGAKVSSLRLLTQIPGTAMRMSRRAFAPAMNALPDFKALMYDYAQAFLDQALVSGACNAAHQLNQRLARWLLTTRDRSESDTLPVTQSLLAEMLGVQRPTMTVALGEFERAGLIAGARRQITVLDRAGLAEEFLRMLPPPARTVGIRCPRARYGLKPVRVIYMTDRFCESSYPNRQDDLPEPPSPIADDRSSSRSL